MKVSDVMSKQVEHVSSDASVKDVCRLIFGRGINGVPVCKGKKIIGFITERDILSKFYPSIVEYVEDPFGEGNFESMEEKVPEILALTANKIMSRNPITVTADIPLLRAQSLMFINKVGRLPVVDNNNNLVGVISKGDIFKAVVGEKLPYEKDEKYHDWLSRRYDTMVDWKTRLEKEIPDLVGLFKKENVKNILDIGCGTGMHVIALAKEGFHAVGIDRSSRVIQVASENTKTLPDVVKQRVKFIHTEYKNLDQILPGTSFDAAISMGSGLAHISDPLQVLRVLMEVNKTMNKKAVFVSQISNHEKIINVNKRLYDFAIRKSPYPEEREQAFLRFYDPKEESVLTLNISVFSRWKNKWVFRGMNLVPLVPLDKGSITSLFKKIGFSNFAYYGGEKGHYYDYLFRKPFRPAQSDVLVVVAKR